MKQLFTLAAAGLMAFVLTACGEDKPRQPEVNQSTTTVQPQKADEQRPADATNPGASTSTTTTTQPQE